MRITRTTFYSAPKTNEVARPREADIVDVMRLICISDIPQISKVSGTIGGYVEIIVGKPVNATYDVVRYHGTEVELQQLRRFVAIAQDYYHRGSSWRIYAVADFYLLREDNSTARVDQEVISRYTSFADFEEFLLIATLAHEEGISLAEAAAAYA